MANLKRWLHIKYFMVGYLGLLVFFSSLYFYDLGIFGRGLLIVLLYSVYDLLWTYIRDRVWYVPVSSWISAFVLAIVAVPRPPVIVLVVLPFLAVVTKQLLHFGKNRHVFNPAASALAIVALVIPVASWWGVVAARFPSSANFSFSDPALLLMLFIVGSAFIILWRQNRWRITVPFLIAYIFFLSVLALNSGVALQRLPYLVLSEVLNGVLLFFATVMLIEPMTSTFPTKRQEMFYGALVGSMAVGFTYLARKFNLLTIDPLVFGLLGGNLVAGLWFLPNRQKVSACACKQKISAIPGEPSYWFRDVPMKTRFPTLMGNHEFDVVIIGGGLAGLSTAYFLAKIGVRVALLEADTIGSGDSGYTTACATRFLDSLDATLAAWDSSAAAIDLLKKIIAEENIICDWQDVDAVCFTRQADKKLQTNFFETVRKLQVEDAVVDFLAKPEANRAVGASVEGAYRKVRSEGIFHMRKFLVALAERAIKNGATFFENSEVVNISLSDKVTIKTKVGSITASRLIVATGLPPVTFFPAVAKILRGSVSYVIDVKFSGHSPLPTGFFWDDLSPYHYYRSVGGGELLLGGEDWVTGEPQPTSNPHNQLSKWLKDLVGEAIPFVVENSWQGSLFSTPDLLPLIGSHSAYGKNVIFLTGWAGNGIAQGFFGGKIAADLASNKNNPFQHLFDCNRPLAWPEASQPVSFDQFDVDKLPENQGKIIEKNGFKLAVIKMQGTTKTFSAICPHLGCMVGWNGDTKTWDCPCHGSRFKPGGSLIRGPAKRGLDPVEIK